ncbi:MAG: radical SAM protein [Nanoarchaeota archaeon]|nr:radical SAM protein [Nanoarchaeota archaeon]
MAELKFQNLLFTAEGKDVYARFMDYFYFIFKDNELLKISDYKVENKKLIFKSSKKTVESKFFLLLDRKFRELKTIGSEKPCMYIHMNSQIPLIGSNEFGIVDRGTNMIELKPITTCNIDCIYCSVDHSKRGLNYIVEEEYIIDELKKVIAVKEAKVNIHIGGQGEPTMYSDLPRLLRDLRKIRRIGSISIATNAVLLNKKYIDRLIKAGLTHFHVSLNAFSGKTADYIAGKKYPLKRVLESLRYISKSAKLIIAPVYLPSVNESDMIEIIGFSKKLNSPVMIQNYLTYKFGKRPVNAIPMKLFFKKLSDWEKKYDINLTGLVEPEIKIDNALDKPFKKGDIISAEVVGEARLRNTKIATAGDRVITVVDCYKKGSIRVKIIRDKDNIFTAVPL